MESDPETNEFIEKLQRLERLDIEWISFVALRESMAIALGDMNSVSRSETLRLAENVLPRILARNDSLLRRKWESREARECREEAAITGLAFETIVENRVSRYEELISRAKGRDEISTLASRRDSYQKLLNVSDDNKSFYEGKIIMVDASLGSDRHNRYQDVFYFNLPRNREMRIRVTHMTKVENINGADLIYEHHWKEEALIRIAAIQYKLMNEYRTLVKDKRFEKQLTRLSNCFCNDLPCKTSDVLPAPNSQFRFPTCTAFVKAANRLQSKESLGISTGYLVPICKLIDTWRKGNPANPETLDGEIISFNIFEDLFNAGNIGSRWLTELELEGIYKAQEVLDPDEKLAIQVQVFE